MIGETFSVVDLNLLVIMCQPLLLTGQWTFIRIAAEAEWIPFSGRVCKRFTAGDCWSA